MISEKEIEKYIGKTTKIEDQIDYARASYLFATALRYEALFWENAYAADQWFDLS